MGVDTALGDEFQFWQPRDQGPENFRAFADEHKHFGFAKPFCQRVIALFVIVPHRNVMARQLLKAFEGAQRVEIIVQNGDVH